MHIRHINAKATALAPTLLLAALAGAGVSELFTLLLFPAAAASSAGTISWMWDLQASAEAHSAYRPGLSLRMHYQPLPGTIGNEGPATTEHMTVE